MQIILAEISAKFDLYFRLFMNSFRTSPVTTVIVGIITLVAAYYVSKLVFRIYIRIFWHIRRFFALSFLYFRLWCQALFRRHYVSFLRFYVMELQGISTEGIKEIFSEYMRARESDIPIEISDLARHYRQEGNVRGVIGVLIAVKSAHNPNLPLIAKNAFELDLLFKNMAHLPSRYKSLLEIINDIINPPCENITDLRGTTIDGTRIKFNATVTYFPYIDKVINAIPKSTLHAAVKEELNGAIGKIHWHAAQTNPKQIARDALDNLKRQQKSYEVMDLSVSEVLREHSDAVRDEEEKRIGNEAKTINDMLNRSSEGLSREVNDHFQVGGITQENLYGKMLNNNLDGQQSSDVHPSF